MFDVIEATDIRRNFQWPQSGPYKVATTALANIVGTVLNGS